MQFRSSLLIKLSYLSILLYQAPLTRKTIYTAVMANNTDKFVYKEGSVSVAFVTTPDEKIAKHLARNLVTSKLAACVNIIPKVTSIYEWEGKLNSDSEVIMMIKTATKNVDQLSEAIRKNHPYSVAEVISFPIKNGNPPYLKWVLETFEGKSDSK